MRSIELSAGTRTVLLRSISALVAVTGLAFSVGALAAPGSEPAAASSQPLDLRAPVKPRAQPVVAAPRPRAAPAKVVAAKKTVTSKHKPAAKRLSVEELDNIPKLVLRDPNAKPPGPAPDVKPLTIAKPENKADVKEAKAEATKTDAPRIEAVKAAATIDANAKADLTAIAQYCGNLTTAASDGRLAWQAKRMDETEARLRDRIAELEAKRTETAEWLQRREDAMKRANEGVVAIYSKMKPESAAAQFSAMDESGAAAILLKLNPRAASTILNEIEAARAARIAAEMAGVGVRREVARVAQ